MKKRFFTNHAKSSAMVVSLAIHAVLIVIALSFVAVTVIQKEDKKFETKNVSRPKMPIKKLQVPIKMKPKRPKPKLRKNIAVKTKMDRKMPDIKMPEIAGVKGGIGSVGDGGLGGSGGVGFTMPEINIFGVKSKGEKIFIMLDSSAEMMSDKMGGILAYTIIKEELVKILHGLPPTAVFNIIVYDPSRTFILFPSMVSANTANVAKVDQWLKPLNAVRLGMGSKDYGVRTLGPGGVENKENFLAGKFKTQREWYRPAMLAMKQQADSVFLLTSRWGGQWHDLAARDKDWYQTSDGKRWNEAYAKSKLLLAEENKQRAAKGQPPRVIRQNIWEMNRAYFPGITHPPIPPKYYYNSRDYTEAMVEIRQMYKPKEIQTKSGLRKKQSKSRIDFSFNVIFFQKVGASSGGDGRFSKLTSRCKGDYKTIAGLEAIQSSVSGGPSD